MRGKSVGKRRFGVGSPEGEDDIKMDLQEI